MMENEVYQKWARTLQQSRLTSFALFLIESAGPVKLLASQLMLGFAPLFNLTESFSWQAFAKMLENNEESRLFASFLREEEIS